MDRELYEACAAMYRTPGTPLPRLMLSRCDDAGIHHARLEPGGHLRTYSEYPPPAARTWCPRAS